jgi:hypothetical protein
MEWTDEPAEILPLPPTAEQWEMIHDHMVTRQSFATHQLEQSARVQKEAAQQAIEAAREEQDAAHRRMLATERLEKAARLQEEATKRMMKAAIEQEEAARLQKELLAEANRLEEHNRQLNARLQLELQAILAELQERARQTQVVKLEQEQARQRMAIMEENLAKSSETTKALEAKAVGYLSDAKAYYDENKALNLELHRAAERLQAEESKRIVSDRKLQ